MVYLQRHQFNVLSGHAVRMPRLHAVLGLAMICGLNFVTSVCVVMFSMTIIISILGRVHTFAVRFVADQAGRTPPVRLLRRMCYYHMQSFKCIHR